MSGRNKHALKYEDYLMKKYLKKNCPVAAQKMNAILNQNEKQLESLNPTAVDWRCYERMSWLADGHKVCSGKRCVTRGEDGSEMPSLKKVSEFHRNSKSPDGLQGQCRDCLARYWHDKPKKSYAGTPPILNKGLPKRCVNCNEERALADYYHTNKATNECKWCASMKLRAKRMAGCRHAIRLCHEYEGGSVNYKNIASFLRWRDGTALRAFLDKYALDTEAGIIVRRGVPTGSGNWHYKYSTGCAAGKLNPNKAICIPGLLPKVTLRPALLINALTQATVPHGTIVHLDGDSKNTKPDNLKQWHIRCPNNPSTFGLALPSREPSTSAGGRVTEPANPGEAWTWRPHRWYSDETVPFEVEIPAGFDGDVQSYVADSEQAKEYIRRCDLGHYQVLCRRGRELARGGNLYYGFGADPSQREHFTAVVRIIRDRFIGLYGEDALNEIARACSE